MLQTPAPFPQVGAIAFRRHTAEPARILRRNADGTAFIERRVNLPGGGTAPLSGAAANCEVPLAELFDDPHIAIPGCAAKARRARRSRAAGGR